jgi:hypothetical protein
VEHVLVGQVRRLHQKLADLLGQFDLTVAAGLNHMLHYHSQVMHYLLVFEVQFGLAVLHLEDDLSTLV